MDGRWLDVETPDADPTRLPPGARLAAFTPVRDYQALADRKAAALLAGNGLIASVPFFFVRTLTALLVEPGTAPPAVKVTIVVLLGLLGVLLLVGGWMSFSALAISADPGPPNLCSYLTIAALPREQYLTSLRDVTYQRAVRDLLRYHHAVALRCVEKFRAVNRSITCFQFAVAVWVVVMVTIAVG